jgi:hypothetical protein
VRRSKPKQRARYQPAPVDELLAKRYWKLTVCRGGCVMCHHYPLTREQAEGRRADLQRVEGHHIVPKQWLRSNGHGGRLWDTRNGMGLCRYHHGRHEARMQPVPRDLLPDGAWEFALELDVDWLLDNAYPEGP